MKDLYMIDKAISCLKKYPLINTAVRITYYILLIIAFASLFSFNSILALLIVIVILLFIIRNRERLWEFIWIFLLSFTIKSHYLPILNSVISFVSLTIIILTAFAPAFKAEYKNFVVLWDGEPNKKRIGYAMSISLFTCALILIVILFYLKSWWHFPDIVEKNFSWTEFLIFLGPSLWFAYNSSFNFYKIIDQDVISPEGLDFWIKFLVNILFSFFSLSTCTHILILMNILPIDDKGRLISFALTLIIEIIIMILFYKMFNSLKSTEKK